MVQQGKKRKLDDEEEDIELEIEKKRKVVSKKIVQALGGIEQLKGVCSGQFSTLQFKNPKRPLGSHPLHADVLPCNALLLTVNVNNSSTENDQDDSKPSFTTNISALMTSSCRFRGILFIIYLFCFVLKILKFNCFSQKQNKRSCRFSIPS